MTKGIDVYVSPFHEHRVGKFRVKSSLLVEAYPVFQDFLSDKLVVRCEHDFSTTSFEYTAYCHTFAVVKEGEDAPFYRVEPWYVSTPSGRVLQRLDHVREG